LPILGFTSEIAVSLVVVATGAGAMVVSHANDSFFWVVTQMSQMNVKNGYTLQSIGSLIIGLAAISVIWILSLILI
jgi:GntP family gluconate:H+ symporter